MEPVRNTYPSQVEKTRIVNLERGKLPPQALDIEEAILGAAMIDKSGLDDALEVISSSDVFYKDAHKYIFEAIKSLNDKGDPVDLLTVSAELKACGKLELAGGDFRLIELTQKTSSSAHMDFHCRIVMQKYIQRQVIKIASTAIEQAYDETTDVFNLMDYVDLQFTAMSEMITHGKRSQSWGEMVDEVLQNVERITNAEGKILGVETGFTKLNAYFGGWRPTDLVFIGARPGMGKTAFTIRSMIEGAKTGACVGYFSLEMSGVQLATRGVANSSNFHMNQLTRTGFEKPEYFKTLIDLLPQIKSLPIHIDDGGGLTIPDFKRKARLMKRRHDVKIIFFDYLQLAAGNSDDIRRDVGKWAYALKAIAKELYITVICLSQLSREVEKRNPPRPRLSDLKESSDVEDAADVVAFLYRPGYYGLEPDDTKLSSDENTEMIIEKNRHGFVGTIGLWFDGNKTKFTDYEVRYDADGATVEDNADVQGWENKAQARSLPLPTAAEAFGKPFSIEDKSDNGNGDVPF